MHQKSLISICVALAISGHAYAQEEPSAPIEEVTVTGVRNAELNAREEERSKNIFSSVISQDDAGNFADQNVAESLQRLPGITLQKSEGEGKFVSVRGLGPGFVTVQQNGAELASAGADDRSFALDAIPADLLGAIEVFKSLTPDMDLNSIGGVVNVKTVSAFDRKKDSLRLSVQDSYQDYMGEHSPKISIQGTNLLADNTIGIGYSASWEKRKTANYEMLHHETTDPRYVRLDVPNTPEEAEDLSSYMLIPFEFQNRQELAERERTAMSLDLGYRPTDNAEYYVRGSYTEFTDMDLAWREYYRFGQAQQTSTTDSNGNVTWEDDIVYLDPSSGTFGVVDADIQQQMFIQETTAKTTSTSVGGKNIFEANNGDYTLDYEYAWSKSTSEKPDGQRVQFRERDVPLIARSSKDYIVAQAISAAELAALIGKTPTEAGFNPNTQTNGYSNEGVLLSGFEFDNLFLEDSSRTDEINAISANLRRDFNDGILNYWKVGFNIKERTRDRNQDRWSLVPASYGTQCEDAPDLAQCRADIRSNLTAHEYAMVDHPDFVYPSITRNGAERLINSVRAIANQDTQQGLESVYRDYTLTEDTAAAYVMGELQLTETQSVTTGVRWEQTKFTSTGYFAINNDNFDVGAGNIVSFDYSIPLLVEETKYDDFYPSIHYRFEPREDVLIRSSVWTSFTRPSFDQARGFANIESDFQLCHPTTGACSTSPGANVTAEDLKSYTLGPDSAIKMGNPGLVAMNSLNFDASIGWYADKNQFLQAAFFYKDIDDFIIEVQGSQLALNNLPIQLPVSQVDGFIIPQDLVMNNVNWTTNGDKAKVYGVELTYVYNFESGYFFQTNTTFMNSSANAGDSIRVGKIQLPEQADITANVTVGWENEDFSFRLIGNYNSEILKRIGSCPSGSEGRLIATPGNSGTTCKKWADQYLDATFGLDFKATYQITDELKVYFDAMNITDEYMTKYFQGNEYSGGKIMYHSEVYGRSFQVGLNYKFM